MWSARVVGLVALVPLLGAVVSTPGLAASAPAPGFAAPTRIDNPWFPLVPDTELVYEGSAKAQTKLLAHRVVFIVTDLTKLIHGVRTRVVWERDYDAGLLAEAELAFFAQDDAGSVWAFGEYPEVWHRGKLRGAPDTWIAGVAGARAGMQMRGTALVGSPPYRQGFAPAIGFDDRAQVAQIDQRVCVTAGCYEHVLVIREWSRADPRGVFQLKSYAPGVGAVQVSYAGGDRDAETLALVAAVHVDGAAAALVQRQALATDRRGYTVAADVYGRTPRARQAGGRARWSGR